MCDTIFRMDFIPIDESSVDHLQSTFIRSFDNYTLKEPRGIASHVPLQLILVADKVNNSILVLNNDLQFVTRFKYRGMVEPWNIAFSGDYETIYVICDHGIVRFNGDYPIFLQPGFELRGCVVYNDRLLTSACYLNQIHEFNRDMNVIATIQPNVQNKGQHSLIIDFIVYNECFYVLFLNCDSQLQVFDMQGNFIKAILFQTKSLETPLFITNYLHNIYISQRDLPVVACVNTLDDVTQFLSFSTSNRDMNEDEWSVMSANRSCGIFYGIEFSTVRNCLIICEML